MAITSPSPLQAEMLPVLLPLEELLLAHSCSSQFLSVEHLCSTLPAGFLCYPMSLGFCVSSSSPAVVSSGTCSLFPLACAGPECLVLLILTQHKLSLRISAWLLLLLNSCLRDAFQT